MCHRHCHIALAAFGALIMAVSGCTEYKPYTPEDAGSEVDSGEDADAGDDTAGDADTDLDAGSDTSPTQDADAEDSSPPPSDADTEDSSPPPDASDDDTGPADPPEPDDCGEDFWDDTHDGSNPWEDFDIDCEEVAASWDCEATAAEELILEMINEARQDEQECGSTSYGPSDELEMDPQLRCAAKLHSWDMDGRNYYDHDTPEGLSPSGRVSIVPGPNHSAAENIYDWWASPEQIFQGWMNSPGHCRNMMCESYNRVGIGIYNGKHTLKITGPGMCW